MKFITSIFAMMLAMMGVANAAIDFTAITAVVDVTTVLAALAAIAALKFGVPFTKWAYAQVTSMFGGK